MNILSGIKKYLKTSIAVAALVVVSSFQLTASAAELNLGGPQDCDSNAVIYCGAQTTSSLISRYNNGTEQNSAKSIQDIYSKFNISSADVNALGTTAVAGRVMKTGEVFVNTSSAAVATNAITAGRLEIAGSTRVTQNGTTFYTRSTGVSFNSASIPAYVVMKDGVFQYAILSSCANPVSATPKTTPKPQTAPNYTLNKTVSKDGSKFDKNVTVAPGTKVTYRITVTSTGTEAAKNVVVRDALPTNVKYVAGTLTQDMGKVSDTSFFSQSGITIASLAVNTASTFQYDAVIGTASSSSTACSNETLTNTARSTATGLPAGTSTAVVNKECAVVNAPVCNGFDISAGEARTITVTKFDYAANGATFNKAVINWDVNKTNENVTITDASKVVGTTHRYTADGTYLVSVTITFTQDGKTVTANGPACQKQVAFTTKPPVVTNTTTPTTPAKPAALVSTGAGSTATMFTLVAALAGGAYHWSLRRRVSVL